ncbi:MAG: hypothetical protein Kow0098_18290 [Ignavibacteriaceae bacterium]
MRYRLNRGTSLLLFSIISFLAGCSSGLSSSGNSGDDGDIKDSQTTYKMIPISDMSASDFYKGEEGGLYGNGSNEIPAGHLSFIQKRIDEIKPVNGKIGFISIGMSNTSYEFKRFMRIASMDKNISEYLVICNGAQGGVTATEWRESSNRCWSELDNRLNRCMLSDDQVQIVWLKTAHREPQISMPDENSDAKQLKDDMIRMIINLKSKFPNLKIIYLSSRIYAGWATTKLNPEPFAYESGFAVRWVIEAQMKNDPELNGEDFPALLWGPYLWSNGEEPNTFGISWAKEDYDPKDFTHPGRSTGTIKAGQILYNFFSDNVLSKKWFYYR